ncbi:MAG: hypothetical protein R6U44_00770 [Archaeoglobaceae archaeon]
MRVYVIVTSAEAETVKLLPSTEMTVSSGLDDVGVPSRVNPEGGTSPKPANPLGLKSSVTVNSSPGVTLSGKSLVAV